IVRGGHGLARIDVDLPGFFHRQRLQLGHLQLRQVGVLAGFGLTTAAASLEAYRDEVLAGLHMHGEEQKKQDHDVQTDRQREWSEQKAQTLAQDVFEAGLFLFRLFLVQMRTSGDPEQDHRDHDYRGREQADFFRNGHAMPFAVTAPTLLPKERRRLRLNYALQGALKYCAPADAATKV